MDTEELGRSRFLNIFFKLGGVAMESRLRRWFMNPERMLHAGGLDSGQTALEVGSGSGFFTVPAAEMIGPRGRLIAMEPLSGFADRVRRKVQGAGLENVEVVQRDALKTGLEDACIDIALLYGVVPFPTLPLERLLPEMYRVLKADGRLAVWLFPAPAGVPSAIMRSGLFTDLGKKDGIYRYGRTEPAA